MKSLDSSHTDRIMIRSTNWIGDAVMTTPAMGAVRNFFPNAEITVVANPPVAELFHFHPYCDRVLVFDKTGKHKGLTGFAGFCKTLRKERFDLAILLQNAIEAAFMAALAGIGRRAGYRTDRRGWLLSHGVKAGERERRLHHTRYYLEMLNALGIGGGDGALKLACTEEELARAVSMLGEGRWIAVNPGAAYGSAKRWYPERFAEVADQLAAAHGTRTVLTGGPGEKEIGRDIESAMKTGPLNLVGRTSVRELMALLSRCNLMITNDSGPMHVAAALGTPIVAIFGPTDHTTTSPLAGDVRIVRKEVGCAPCLLRQCPTDHRCMDAVRAEDVFRAADDLLGSIP